MTSLYLQTAFSFFQSASLEAGILFLSIFTSNQSPGPIDSMFSGFLDANSPFPFPLQFSSAYHCIISTLILSQHSFLHDLFFSRWHTTKVIYAYCPYSLNTGIKFPVIWLQPAYFTESAPLKINNLLIPKSNGLLCAILPNFSVSPDTINHYSLFSSTSASMKLPSFLTFQIASL